VPELNLGQLSKLVRAEFLVDARVLSKMQCAPLRASEIDLGIEAILEGAL
jgi:2-oxoglutarate ferredoxin oxidoreductase subunit alpha